MNKVNFYNYRTNEELFLKRVYYKKQITLFSIKLSSLYTQKYTRSKSDYLNQSISFFETELERCVSYILKIDDVLIKRFKKVLKNEKN
ncbi:MAG: hypothetical protein NTZ60_02675 [Campylobacterales bacterium]|nr:hypothetical protein [Campylobacterales bacterium]